MASKLIAEFIGTMWLVLGGCGSAVLAAGFPGVGIGLLGVSLAFGLTVLTMAYAVGPISGGHFNPAVSLGLWAGGPLSGEPARALHRCASRGRRGRRRDPVRHRQRPGRLRCERRIRGQRLRRALARQVLPRCGAGHRGGHDLRLPGRHPGIDPPTRAGGLRRHRDRAGADAHPPGEHSRHQHVGESGSQHRSGGVRRELGSGATVALLAGPDRRRAARGRAVPGAAWPTNSWSRRVASEPAGPSLPRAVA